MAALRGRDEGILGPALGAPDLAHSQHGSPRREGVADGAEEHAGALQFGHGPIELAAMLIRRSQVTAGRRFDHWLAFGLGLSDQPLEQRDRPVAVAGQVGAGRLLQQPRDVGRRGRRRERLGRPE